MRYSSLAAEIWNEYAAEFQRRWGIDNEVSAIIGARSKTVWAAEYAENGDLAYRTSVILPIRNAFYAASAIDKRWDVLRGMQLEEPILDYGCGVGYQLLWLRRQGFRQLFGYEVQGVQRKVLVAMTEKRNIHMWKNEKVATVLCTNMLEHVSDPVGMLNKLLDTGKRVIANVCMSRDASHIAPYEELDKCRAILESRGTFYHGDDVPCQISA